MKKISVLLFIPLLIFGMSSFAQNDGGVSIGKGSSPANQKSILELVSNTKGLLIPRMTDTERIAIFSGSDQSAKGLMVFDDTRNAFYFWDGSAWKAIASGNVMTVSGTPSTLGTTGELVFDTQNSVLYIYDGGKWLKVVADNAKTALASEVKVIPNTTVGLSSVNVQDALLELQDKIKTASGGGMNSVVHDASLSGNGTDGIPLNVAPGGISGSHLKDAAVTAAKISGGGNNKILTTDGTGTTVWADKSSLGGSGGNSTLVHDLTLTGDGTASFPLGLKDGMVTASKISGGGSDKILTTDGTGTAVWIDKSSLGGSGGNSSSVITDNTLTGDGTALFRLGLASDAVTSDKIGFGAVTAAKIEDDAVTSSKIAFGAVTSAKIDDDAVTSTKIHDFAVTTSKIEDEAVSTAKIAFGAATAEKIGYRAVTTEKIEEEAVTSSKILDGTIQAKDLGSMNAQDGYTLQWKGGFGWLALPGSVGINTGDQNLAPYALKVNVLELTNTTTFMPTDNYQPATKKYVDDHTGALASIGTTTILGNNTGAAAAPAALSTTQVKTMLAITKSDVSLGNVDNTNDLAKPISIATQSALDGKVDKNANITAGTATKIIYDSKGLVTAGAAATTADINSVTDKRYVTEAQLTVIGSTSGTNTGDETVAGMLTKLGATTVTGSNTGDQKLDLIGNNLTISGTGGNTVDLSLIGGSDITGITSGLGLTGGGTSGNITLGLKPVTSNSILGNNTAGVAAPTPLTGADIKTILALTKADVGLGNVENTKDDDKIVSKLTQTALDGKVDGNGAIIGATKTKITYDSKGLVTVGGDAIATDIIVAPNGTLVSTNVQAALEELQGKITTAASGGMVGVSHDGTLSGDGNSTNPLSLADKSVTLTKMADLPAKSLIGNSTAALAAPEAISLGSGLTLSGGVLSAAGGSVTLSGENYLTLSGQDINAKAIDLSGSNATGILAPASFPALTGDVTNTAGSLATTLSSTGVTAGTYKSVTVDAKGRVSAGTNPTTTLDDLSDVAITSHVTGDVLQWDGTQWVNKPNVTGNQSIAFTPTGDVTGSVTGTTSLTPSLVIGAGKVVNSMLATGIDATKIVGILPISTIPTTLTGITSVNGLQLNSLPTGFSITGGTTPKTFTVTDNASVAGTNTGDQTAVTVSINPITGITGTTVQGALAEIKSQSNTNTADLSAKLTANSAITGATHTKITYDAKGLVTTGVDATTADISESPNKKYVTDSQSTMLSNTSGNNTGDQTLSLAGNTISLTGGGSVTGIGDITSVVAGTGLTGGGTTGDVTLNLAPNAVGTSSLKGSSGALGNGGGNGFVLQSNGDGTFSWKDITAGVAADPSSLGLGTGQFFIGDASSKASAISKIAIPMSGFAPAAATVDMGNNIISNLAIPVSATDAVNKTYADTKIAQSAIGLASGVVPLNTLGTIDEKYLPGSMVGAVNYTGTYDVPSNTIAPAAPANKGDYFVISTAGTYNTVAYSTGDWIISDGIQWSKVSNNNGVTTIFGRAGVVTAGSGDYNTDLVTEGSTNKYYTEAKVSANITVTGKEDFANKSLNVIPDAASDTKYPSVKAVKTYVDAKVPASAAGNNGQVLTVNASGNPTWQDIVGGGSVTTVSVTPNAGVSGVVTNPTSTPAIALTLGDITPTKITTAGSITTTGAISAGSISTGALTTTGSLSGTNLSGTNTGDQGIAITGSDISGTPNSATKTTSIGLSLNDNSITSAKILDKTITYSDIADATITPAKLNIAGTASVGAVPAYNATGGFTWGTGGGTNIGYTNSTGILTSSTGTGFSFPMGSTSTPSLMIAADKTKLDGIAANANNYSLPIAAAGTLGGIKVGSNLSIDASGVLSATSSGLTAINASTLLGNNTASSAVPTALNATAVRTFLSIDNVENTTDLLKVISTATQNALNLKQDVANLSSNVTTDAGSITKYPSVSAIKTYVDAQVSAAGGGDMFLATSQSVAGLKTFNNSMLAMKGSSTGSTTFSTANASATTYTLTLPAANGTVALSTSPLSQFAATTSAQLAGVISDETGSGSLVFATSPTLLTPVLGVASATSITAIGNLSGSQLISTIANGTAPLVVTSTTPVANLSIGGNAANIAGGSVGQILYQSAANTTAKLPVGSVGQVLQSNGAAAPVWATVGGGSGTITSIATANGLSGASTTGSVTIGINDAGIALTKLATIPTKTIVGNNTASSASPTTLDAATAKSLLSLDLVKNVDQTNATNLTSGTVAPARLASGTADGTTYLRGDGIWSTVPGGSPAMTYYSSATDGKVQAGSGATATIPLATPTAGTNLAGLMIPADKTKLDKLPTVTNAPVSTAGQVLTSNSDGTATWAAAPSGGGGGGSVIYKAVAQDGITNVPNVLAKGSGGKVKFWIDQATVPKSLHVFIPTGAIIDYVRIFIQVGDITQNVNNFDFKLAITDESGATNNSHLDALIPNIQFWTLTDSNPGTVPWSPASSSVMGGLAILSCSGGTLLFIQSLSNSDMAGNPGGAYIVLSF